ncbi:MAG: hypothetical protein ABFC34_12295 [Methanobacterium sp.]
MPNIRKCDINIDNYQSIYQSRNPELGNYFIKLEGKYMVKIKNWVNFGLGLFLELCFVLRYMINSLIDFSGVIIICWGTFLILDAILDNKSAILMSLLGVILLISFIALLSQKQSFSALDVVIYIGLPLIMIIMGIGVHLGFLPKKIFKSN